MRSGRLLVGLLAVGLIAAPLWAEDEAAAKKAAKNTAVFTKEGHVTVHVTATAEAGKDGKPKVQIKTVRVKPDGKVEVRGSVAAKAIAVQPPRLVGVTWIGIRVSPVPAALNAQLGLNGKGVMVGNVIKGSPADKAGLDRYDVIVAAGKAKEVEGSEQFISEIRGRKPGVTVQLWVMHKGRKRPVSITPGKAPTDAAKWKWVYEEDPDEQWADELKLHRGMLRKGPQGWIFEGPKGGIDLPKGIMEVLPKGVWGGMQIHVDGTGGGRKSFKISRSIDGEKIEIESSDGKEIVVRKTKPGEDGKGTVTRKYKDADELRKKDPAAYELYKSVNVGGAAAGRGYQLRLTPEIKYKDAAEAIKKAQEQVQKQIQEQMKHWAEKAKDQARGARYRIARAVEPEKAHREFDVVDDGRINVRVREGDTEAKLTFKDADEMKAKAPKLYKAYEKLLKDDK